MSKRRRDDTIIRHHKRACPWTSSSPIEHKKKKALEYWHHGELSREERAAEMTAMYIHLLGHANKM